jgi:transcriptional regulator with XRE-family HTH domain
MHEAAPFGAWLKQRRRTLDLTQGDLANLVGCSTDTIYRLEAGTRRPSKQIVQRLLMVLEIPAAQASAFLNVARLTGGNEPGTDTRLPPLSVVARSSPTSPCCWCVRKCAW